MLASGGTLEKDAAVVGPGTILVSVERASTHTVLAGANDDVLLAVSLEIIGVAEVVAQPGGAAVDDDALLLPVGEFAVKCLGLGNGSLGIVYCRI